MFSSVRLHISKGTHGPTSIDMLHKKILNTSRLKPDGHMFKHPSNKNFFLNSSLSTMGGVPFVAIHEPHFKKQKAICQPVGRRKTNNKKLISTCCSNIN